MDYLAAERNHLPAELMMENAGLQLARRLAGWVFQVHLDIPVKKLNELPLIQLERALATGTSK